MSRINIALVLIYVVNELDFVRNNNIDEAYSNWILIDKNLNCEEVI